MLSLHLAVSAAMLGLGLSLTAQNGPAPTPPPLHLVEYGADLGLRDELIRTGTFYGDLGTQGVAALSPQLADSLAARGVHAEPIPALRAGEVLVQSARDAHGRGAVFGRLLFARRAYFLLAAMPDLVPEHLRGCAFHGGLQVVPLDAPYAAAAGRCVTFALPESVDPRIAALVAQVQRARLLPHVQALSAIYTRRATRAENAQAIAYVSNALATIPGLTFRTETFSSSYGPNLIAEIPGTDLANEIVMVGAHIDSLAGSSSTRAPGADDNASGSATVLELARILAGQPFRRTLRFGWWNAEEFGLIGSIAYANAAAARGDRIVAYVNTDMNAYRAAGDALDLDFITNDSTPSLIQALTAASQTYVPTLPIVSGTLSGGTSDHRSFFRAGFPAAFPFEDLDHYSPYIHTTNDTVGVSANDFQLSELISQSVLAGIATLAEPASLPPRFTLDVASGPTVGGTAVVATGTDLDTVTDVAVGGRSVTFTQPTAGSVAFATPTSPIAGPVDVVLTNPQGTGRQPFTFVLTAPPDLRAPATLGLGEGGSLGLGGVPGDTGIVLLSPNLGATNLVVVQLGIGGGVPAAIFSLAVGPLSPSGGTVEFPLTIPNEPALLGVSFHLQGVDVDPALTALVPTGVRTLTIQ
ncbi:MAG: M28 family peptidase [Planctomycetes bacterium]|nr:M28 family peptidase [Planctomycetota bacterium]